MRSRLLVATTLVVAGCYAPDVPSNVPCSEHGACPASQTCIADVCEPDLPWSAPKRLSELDDPEGGEDPFVTEDKLTVVWSSSRSGGAGNNDLWMATRASVDAPFGNITNLAALNTSSNEQAPNITVEGQTIYFVSNRNGDDDIWVAQRASSGWSVPTRVSELSRSGSDESDLAITSDRLTVIIQRDDAFVRATRTSTTLPFGAFISIPELDITNDVGSPTVGVGAKVIYFHLGSPRELYVSHLGPTGTYEMPTRVDELDNALRNADPCITTDEHYMIYNCETSMCETTR